MGGKVSKKRMEIKRAFQVILDIIIAISLAIVSYYILHYILPLGISGVLVLFDIVFTPILLFICYSLIKFDERFEEINKTVREGFGLHLQKTESKSASGSVFYKCTHVKVEKIEKKEKIWEIYVGCNRGIVERGGCPRPCIEYAEPPKPKSSGVGAFWGVTGGGALGLIGGPVGVIVGAVFGGFLGDAMEKSSLKSLPSKLEKTIEDCRKEDKIPKLYL